VHFGENSAGALKGTGVGSRNDAKFYQTSNIPVYNMIIEQTLHVHSSMDTKATT
jgi:hypothetical protein